MPGDAEPAIVRVSLPELLAQRCISHPTRVTRVVIAAGRLEIVVLGYPWWRDGDRARSQEMTLIFGKLSEGTVPVDFGLDDNSDEDLDGFSIQSLSAMAWAETPRNAIYCHAPLQDAARLYAILQAFLHRLGALKGPGDFLNQGHLLQDFERLSAGNSYLLARAPDVLRSLLCDELDRQQVPHNIIQHATSVDTRLWVRFGDQGFLCGEAWAEFAA